TWQQGNEGTSWGLRSGNCQGAALRRSLNCHAYAPRERRVACKDEAESVPNLTVEAATVRVKARIRSVPANLHSQERKDSCESERETYHSSWGLSRCWRCALGM